MQSSISKRVLLFLILLGGVFACENTVRNEQTDNPVPNTLQEDTAAQKAGTVNVRAGADTTIQSNSLMHILMPQWTVAEVLRMIPEAKITKSEPVPNRHIQDQMDTLVTIKSDSTVFQFYRVKGKDMLKSATLNSRGLTLANGIEIGMKPEEAIRLIPTMKGKKNIPQSLLIRTDQTPASIRLQFQQKRLAFIRIDGYVD
ncbi:MAG: hypothetical protein KY428_08185 [Bacteroidetes bacterium]|nr:hypothetical protein [Bacteroidota bacterium]